MKLIRALACTASKFTHCCYAADDILRVLDGESVELRIDENRLQEVAPTQEQRNILKLLATLCLNRAKQFGEDTVGYHVLALLSGLYVAGVECQEPAFYRALSEMISFTMPQLEAINMENEHESRAL